MGSEGIGTTLACLIFHIGISAFLCPVLHKCIGPWSVNVMGVLGIRSPEAYTQPSTGLTNQNGHCQTHGCGWSPAEAQRAPWRGCYNDGGKREVCEEVSFGSDVVSLF